MANQLYPAGRNGFLTGSIHWGGASPDTFRVYLIDTADYTFSTSHDYLNDVPSAARVAYATLTNTSATDGVADADDVTFTSVTGDQSEALIICKWTGNEATSNLIAYIDTATGLPVTPNGGDITVTWDNGSNKIFKL